MGADGKVPVSKKKRKCVTDAALMKEPPLQLIKLDLEESILRQNYELECRGYQYPSIKMTLPDFSGITALAKSEIKRDFRQIDQFIALSALSSVHDLEQSLDQIPSKYELVKKKTKKTKSTLMPEEIAASLPTCRKAVHLTKVEIQAMARERESLETEFLLQRSKLLYRMSEMQDELELQNKVMGAFKLDIRKKAQSLEIRKRRSTSMQNLLMELEARGNTIDQLQEECRILRLHQEASSVEESSLSSSTDMCVDDPVQVDTRVTEDPIMEENQLSQAMKRRFYDLASSWAEAEEKYLTDVGESSAMESSSSLLEHTNNQPRSTDGKHQPLIFNSSRLRDIPSDVPLLLSPLSTSPDKVVASGPEALSWHPSLLPSDMSTWENERLAHYRLQGDYERLKVTCAQEQRDKKDLQRRLAEQMETIEELVYDLQVARGQEEEEEEESMDTETSSSKESRKMSKVHVQGHNDDVLEEEEEEGAKSASEESSTGATLMNVIKTRRGSISVHETTASSSSSSGTSHSSAKAPPRNHQAKHNTSGGESPPKGMSSGRKTRGNHKSSKKSEEDSSKPENLEDQDKNEEQERVLSPPEISELNQEKDTGALSNNNRRRSRRSRLSQSSQENVATESNDVVESNLGTAAHTEMNEDPPSPPLSFQQPSLSSSGRRRSARSQIIPETVVSTNNTSSNVHHHSNSKSARNSVHQKKQKHHDELLDSASSQPSFMTKVEDEIEPLAQVPNSNTKSRSTRSKRSTRATIA